MPRNSPSSSRPTTAARGSERLLSISGEPDGAETGLRSHRRRRRRDGRHGEDAEGLPDGLSADGRLHDARRASASSKRGRRPRCRHVSPLPGRRHDRRPRAYRRASAGPTRRRAERRGRSRQDRLRAASPRGAMEALPGGSAQPVLRRTADEDGDYAHKLLGRRISASLASSSMPSAASGRNSRGPVGRRDFSGTTPKLGFRLNEHGARFRFVDAARSFEEDDETLRDAMRDREARGRIQLLKLEMHPAMLPRAA